MSDRVEWAAYETYATVCPSNTRTMKTIERLQWWLDLNLARKHGLLSPDGLKEYAALTKRLQIHLRVPADVRAMWDHSSGKDAHIEQALFTLDTWKAVHRQNVEEGTV